jgi:hypothetical protein
MKLEGTEYMNKIGQIVMMLGFLSVTLNLMHGSAFADDFDCHPDEVNEVTSGRVFVHCSNSIVLSGATIRFISILTTDQSTASRFVSLATAALLSGKVFRVDVPASSATNVSGCGASNCRTPASFSLAD